MKDNQLALLRGILARKFYDKLGKNTEFALNTRINSIKNRVHYSRPPDPWKILYVSTDAIEYRCDNIRNTVGLARVQNGDWDLPSEASKINSYWRIKGLKQRFEKGWDWDETTYYKTVVEKIEQDGSYWGYDSIEEFEERLVYNDGLFKRISEEGFRNTSGLDPNLPDSDARTDKYRKINELQVLLCIGRDGKFLLKEGHHRYAIADILGSDMPVLILARHQNWQETRDEMGEAESIEDLTPELHELLDHPDMADIRSSIDNHI